MQDGSLNFTNHEGMKFPLSQFSKLSSLLLKNHVIFISKKDKIIRHAYFDVYIFRFALSFGKRCFCVCTMDNLFANLLGRTCLQLSYQTNFTLFKCFNICILRWENHSLMISKLFDQVLLLLKAEWETVVTCKLEQGQLKSQLPYLSRHNENFGVP